uniref:CD36 family protein n=1 Tax=Caenorhabditis japonica TaxID=281687 RepID=A0A8R1HZ51_CAEJA
MFESRSDSDSMDLGAITGAFCNVNASVVRIYPAESPFSGEAIDINCEMPRRKNQQAHVYVKKLIFTLRACKFPTDIQEVTWMIPDDSGSSRSTNPVPFLRSLFDDMQDIILEYFQLDDERLCRGIYDKESCLEMNCLKGIADAAARKNRYFVMHKARRVFLLATFHHQFKAALSDLKRSVYIPPSHGQRFGIFKLLLFRRRNSPLKTKHGRINTKSFETQKERIFQQPQQQPRDVSKTDISKPEISKPRQPGSEYQEKIYHQFALNDTRVFYKNQKKYIFNRNASCPTCDLDVKVTIPNVVFQKLVDVSNITIFGVRIRFAIEAVLKLVKEAPYITVHVREALFDGYEDPIIDLVCKNQILKFLCETNTIQKRVGFFYEQNGTTDGIYEVDTGVPSPFKIGHLYTWNNLTMMPEGTWDSEYARMINGTDGQLFSPMLKREQRLTLFVPQICRSVQMEYQKDVSVSGVPSWRYIPPQDLYDPALPQNRAFCNKAGMPRFFDNTTVQIENCLPAGLIDLSRCQSGSPRVYLSNPNFYNSPKELWHAVTGLAVPSPSNDVTYVDIEPVAGVPARAKRIMQINVGMVKGDLSITKNTTNVIVPVLWMNDTAYFDDATRDQLYEIFKAKHFSFIGGVVCLSLGLVAWLAVFVVIIAYTRQANDDEYGRLVLEDDDDEVPPQNETATLAEA